MSGRDKNGSMRAAISDERGPVPLRPDSDSVHGPQLPEILLWQPGCLHGEHTDHGGAVQLFPVQREAGAP